MKALIIVISIILVIVIGWFFIYESVGNSTEDFILMLTEVATSIEDSDWERAKNQFIEAREKWIKLRNMWTILLDHHEIDNIDLSMARANKFVESQNTSLSLGEIEVLKELFKIVKENEALTLTNIL